MGSQFQSHLDSTLGTKCDQNQSGRGKSSGWWKKKKQTKTKILSRYSGANQFLQKFYSHASKPFSK